MQGRDFLAESTLTEWAAVLTPVIMAVFGMLAAAWGSSIRDLIRRVAADFDAKIEGVQEELGALRYDLKENTTATNASMIQLAEVRANLEHNSSSITEIKVRLSQLERSRTAGGADPR